ncbi:MAG: T9SS type A sorting domain-containing protein, partial [Bacteroidia bacterium]
YGGNTAHNVLFPSSANINGNNTIHKATFMNGNVNISGNSSFDSLLFNNPGNTVTLSSGTTQTVNDALLENALPGFPILMHSSSLGSQATISKSSGNVCLNYFIMQDMNATGGAQFYAGDYSVNLGNNTGWSFTSCAPAISNVWPGDANYDLTCDNIDILYIGVAYNDTGYVRSGANLTWTAQPALDWLSQFLTGQNAKHADCDGNGIVDANDTLAVSLNYGLIHPPRLSSPDFFLSGPDLYFEMPAGNLVPGSNVSVPIKLGTPPNPANNVYGIAFTIGYDPALVQAGSVYLDYSTSWIATPTNFIHLEKDFSAFGNFDMGLCRINHTNVSGNGTIATLHFTVASTASGWLTLSFSDVLAISANELPVPVNPLPSVVYTNVEEHVSSETLSIYPNPVNDYLYFNTHNNSFERIEIFDKLGRKVIEANPNINKIYLGNIPSGMYLLSATDKETKGTIKLKFIKQ